MFSFRSLLRRRISFSPLQPPPSVPPATFREAHLRPKPTFFEAPAADLPAGGNPAGNQQLTRRHARFFSSSLPSTRRRVWARVFFSGDGTPHAGSSGAVFTFYPSGGPTRALLIHLLAFSASADAFSPSPTPSVHLRCLQFILSHLQFIFSRILYGLDLLFLHLQAPQP